MELEKWEGLGDDETKVDRISNLPREVLELIICLLTFKEAVATSILSRSWRYSWILSNKLDFDSSPPFAELPESYCCYIPAYKERSNSVRWINRFIALSKFFNQKSDLEAFRAVVDLSESDRWIDDWLSYAFSRKVGRLELIVAEEFRSREGIAYSSNYDMCYNFPYKEGNCPSNFKLLKKLSMHCVRVSGEALEFFLGNCRLLEELSVSSSQLLSSLEIVGTFPAFKCLELSMCYNLKSVSVRDSGLITLKYSGDDVIEFVMVNVPLLTRLWVMLRFNNLNAVARMFSSVLPQLEMLKIILSCAGLSWTDSMEFTSNVKLSNLKQLVVNTRLGYGDNDGSLSPLINLISASPLLQRFVVEAAHGRHRIPRPDWVGLVKVPEKNLTAYRHLKEVEFVGYHGTGEQFQLIKHFVEKDDALESVVINPRCFGLRSYRPWDCVPLPDEVHASLRATAEQQLKELLVPSRINVKII